MKPDNRIKIEEPCRKCGNKAALKKQTHEPVKYNVSCTHCGCQTPLFSEPNEAIACWTGWCSFL